MREKKIMSVLSILCLALSFEAAVAQKAVNRAPEVVVTETDFTKLKLDPSEKVTVKGEKMVLKPVKPRGWSGGTRLKQIQTIRPGLGTTAYGALAPGSIVVRQKGKILELEKDYFIDAPWGMVSWGEGNVKPEGENEVEADYEFHLLRLDSIIENADGKKVLRKGKSHLTAPKAPELKDDNEKRVCNLFVSYGSDGTKFDVYPVSESSEDAVTLTKPGMIPKTMAKIKAGKPVKIVNWGDSVTNGGDATRKGKYTAVFKKRMMEKFPNAKLDFEVIAVGGSNARQWLYPEQFKGNRKTKLCDWNKIVNAKPDLITIEFVNDAGMVGGNPRFTKVYTDLLKKINDIGAEIIFITPHFTMPSMMKFKTLRDKDQRPYILALREFAKKNNIALADAASRWEHLWKEGIPYITYLQNAINHPDDAGHAIFADELMKCF